jgi:hypothetical protein
MTLYKRSTCMSKPVLFELLYRCASCDRSFVLNEQPDGSVPCDRCSELMELVTASGSLSEDDKESKDS